MMNNKQNKKVKFILDGNLEAEGVVVDVLEKGSNFGFTTLAETLLRVKLLETPIGAHPNRHPAGDVYLIPETEVRG